MSGSGGAVQVVGVAGKLEHRRALFHGLPVQHIDLRRRKGFGRFPYFPSDGKDHRREAILR